MRLDLATWPEVEACLDRGAGAILPAGSIEQHGPMGLIGTDAFCAEAVALGAGERLGAMVAPTLRYAPAPFNTAFAGTLSISEPLFEALAREVVEGLLAQGFRRVYVINGHGANLAPLARVAAAVADRRPGGALRLRSWWDYPAVNRLRDAYYGDWEGMHATPSEIAVTQATRRIVAPGAAQDPPAPLPPGYARAHAGDRHGPPDAHRARFPDGRVGSHSALARPEHGRALLDAAIAAAAEDCAAWFAG